MTELTRRQALAASGVLALTVVGCGGDDEPATSSSQPSSAATATTQATTAADCVLTPEQTEGPYYLPDSMVRSDITEGRDGAPLELELAVQHAERCEPIQNATVEIWHCDAEGEYSGVGADGTFLRGGQKTSRDGVATFRTIYPGWYQGRTTHIHVKVHVDGSEVHTGQLYFDDVLTAAVNKAAPYNSRGGTPDTTNADDGIYSQGGRQSTVKVERSGDGYTGRLTMGVNT